MTWKELKEELDKLIEDNEEIYRIDIFRPIKRDLERGWLAREEYGLGVKIHN